MIHYIARYDVVQHTETGLRYVRRECGVTGRCTYSPTQANTRRGVSRVLRAASKSRRKEWVTMPDDGVFEDVRL